MIQRASVWKPHQVMDLWDTLLRGMPIGGMMASLVREGAYFRPISRDLAQVPLRGALSLVDGQQRTLAMLIAWPAVATSMNRRIWIDLGADDSHDHRFRFHLTTETQLFGFELAGPSGSAVAKLPTDVRRVAAFAYGLLGLSKDKYFVERASLWRNQDVFPWLAVFPVNLQDAIETLRNLNFSENQFCEWVEKSLLEKRKCHYDSLLNKLGSGDGSRLWTQAEAHIKKRLHDLERLKSDDALSTRSRNLYFCLTRFNQAHLAVIEVPKQVMAGESEDTSKDPALAILFQRIGTGGTKLENADYVFSVMKHRISECHGFVENMLDEENLKSIFTPVTLVTTAVRVTAAELGLGDYARVDKTQFAQLLKEGKFEDAFKKNIGPDGSFRKQIHELLVTLRYTGEKEDRKLDIGFPKHALCLLQLPIIETVLCWLNKVSGQTEALQHNRHRLIRFFLYCALTVRDSHKASELLIRKIKEATAGGNDFPERDFVNPLIKAKLAMRMCAPAEFEADPILKRVIRTKGQRLRGWQRFDLVSNLDDTPFEEEARERVESAINLYARFWNRKQNWRYEHELLLWLQRDYIDAAFEQYPALPGAEDETPYDYDHVCPQSHWSGWTGVVKGNGAIIDFLDGGEAARNSQPQTLLGNSIGNVRVWDSSLNRGDSDASPAKKLEQEGGTDILKDSAIDRLEDWKACSPKEESKPRLWDEVRTGSFQEAIENRTFSLYRRLYNDLAFGELQA